jgi:hypothetical protein
MRRQCHGAEVPLSIVAICSIRMKALAPWYRRRVRMA